MVLMREEIRQHLTEKLIPFWRSLRDDGHGGYYGYVGFDLAVDRQAEKGCILNSRILWFFANAYMALAKEGITSEDLLEEARHAYRFLTEHCIDKKCGGIYWSMNYDGTPKDTTKHTYNQAFAIYALSSYYDASGDTQALNYAFSLFRLIEDKCTDERGYLEAFTREFAPQSNEKLSENGVMAERTMNTLLHVFEAYTELYRVTGDADVRERLYWILDVFADKVYNPALRRQEVFFDGDYNSLIDLHSYGHDIETAWLIDRGVEVLGDEAYEKKMSVITRTLTEQIYQTAFDGHSLANECEKGVVDEKRVWWVQAEAIVGFLNGCQKDEGQKKYLQAATAVWEYIKARLIDPRENSEWYWYVDRDGRPAEDEPIVEPWKCPYHNGRMCMEVMRRL